MEFVSVPKARPGDKVAVLSPSFAAPAVAPRINEQALERLAALTELEPVEFPTTRELGASARDRAADFNAAFADPDIRAVLATIGGDDQITVVPHLDAELVRRDPKPFLGYSDNTNILNWLWTHGVPGYYVGSTQVQLGPGPGIDPIHAQALRAALLTGERLEITEPGESEDFGRDWNDPRALTESGEREPTEAWVWSGPSTSVTGRTWGGCIEVIQWILTAGRFPSDLAVLDGGVARPPTSDFTVRPSAEERKAKRDEQRDMAISLVDRYNPDALVVVGPPFGHTRPQWIVPYGGQMTVDGSAKRLFADYR
ncbi:MAG: LD-carboxypeptidase [Nocardioides sp.]|uniref:LD-carboxypeptidase n=1 Tax=Nocardioides sp. TaxID=35761 RepID=UPI0039E6B288